MLPVLNRLLIYSYFALGVVFILSQNSIIDYYPNIYRYVLYFTKAIPVLIALLLLPVFWFDGKLCLPAGSRFLNRVMLLWFANGFFSMTAGIIQGNELVYVAGDTLGWLVIPICYFGFLTVLKNMEREVGHYLKVLFYSAVIISIAIITRYVLWHFWGLGSLKATGIIYYPAIIFLTLTIISGQFARSAKKVFGLCFNAYTRYFYLVLFLTALIITFRRTSFIVFCVCLILTIVMSAPKLSLKNLRTFLICAVILITVFSVAPTEHIYDKFINTIGNEGQTLQTKVDINTGFRLLEITEQMRHFSLHGNIITLFTGFGAGTQYEFRDIFSGITEYQHHGHFTYSVVLLRNGILGLLLLLSAGAYIFISTIRIRSRNKLVLLPAISICAYYLDYITAQYLYFSIELPLMMAFWSYLKSKRLDF